MRNFWVAIIGVLMIASFAGTSFATAPEVQDIPDFRLLTIEGNVDDFDLDNYVTDADAGAANLLWTIESQTGFLDAGPATLDATPNDNLLDIASRSSVQSGIVTLRATDVINASAEYAEDTSVVKYSTVMLVGPGLTQDYNLFPATDGIPRTLVLQGDTAIPVSGISSLVQPAQGGTIEYSVSIADLDGTLLAGDNTGTAAYGDLTAAIQSDGSLTLSVPAGAYPITGMYQLSGAYRVGVKAKLTGGLGEANWDGMELLVSTNRFPTNIDQNTPDLLEKFSSFEGVPTGDLPTSVAAMRALPSADNSRWFMIQSAGGATAKIVSSGIPTSTWATDGTQALEVSVADGGFAFIESEQFTDIQPGETVTFAANVTTTGTVTTVPDVYMFMGSHLIAANYDGVLYQKAGNAVESAVQVPINSVWRTLKVAFTADEVGAAIADGSNPDVNVYSQGYRAFFAITGHGDAKVYIDNIRVYRDKSDIDKALGATKIDPVLYVSGAPTTTHFDGTFESSTDTAALGWYVYAAENNHDGALAISSAYNRTPVYPVGSHSLEIYIPGAENRAAGSRSLVEYVMCDVQTDASSAGGVDFSGDGIYAMTLWYKTNADAPKNTPGIMFGMTGLRFLNIPFTDCGYAGAPLGVDPWKKVTVSSARYDYGKKLKVFAIIRADNPALLPSRDYYGSYQNDEKFGADANAHVFIDDLQIHKVMDEAMYFDRSVFPAD